MDPLKLVALDKDDVEVISTHLQDATLKVSDVVWRAGEKRLVIGLNRFDWADYVAFSSPAPEATGRASS